MKKKTDYFHSSVETDSQRILSDATPFAIREAYRSFYTNVLYLPIEDKCKKIVITSAFPGEGKTSVSINLAYTIAINSPESKILIIDADMRSPRVIELLSLNDKKRRGLSEYLAGIDENSLLQATDTAILANQNGDYGIPVPDYVEENVSTKVVKLIQSYTGVVNKMVWRKF